MLLGLFKSYQQGEIIMYSYHISFPFHCCTVISCCIQEDPTFGGDVPVPPNNALEQLARAVVKQVKSLKSS